VKIDEILNFEPKVNVQMLIFLFLNAVAFKLEFKRLNKKCNLLKTMDDLGVGYPARN